MVLTTNFSDFIPEINPDLKLDRKETINLLLASVAMEVIAMSRILDAESNNIQHILKNGPSIIEILNVNRSVERILHSIVFKEIILQIQLENVIDLELCKPRIECEEEEGE